MESQTPLSSFTLFGSRPHGSEIGPAAAGFHLCNFRNFRQTLNNLHICLARNEEIEPDTVMSGLLPEIEACGRHRVVLQDLIDRCERLIEIRDDQFIAIRLAALNLV